MQKHVYFVRHGESDANVDGIFRGSAEALNERGRDQADIVADRIAKIGVEAVVSSPFPRALHTAHAIGKTIELPVEESELFVERGRPSMLQGHTYEEPAMVEMSKQIFDGYLSEGYRHSDEENLDDLRARASAALAFLENHPKDRICVVTHLVFLKTLFAAMWTEKELPGIDLQRALTGLFVANTAVSYARFSSPPEYHGSNGVPMHAWRFISWNDSTHLD
jgi:broad specificity phosphatase PhoE